MFAEAFPIEFEKEPEDIEVFIGDTTQLSCQVREEAHIEACRWYWQPVGHSQAWRVLMREFLPAGSDCSIQFANVTADPEGLWLCHVKPIHSPKFIASKSAKLTVRGGNSTLLECENVFLQLISGSWWFMVPLVNDHYNNGNINLNSCGTFDIHTHY